MLHTTRAALDFCPLFQNVFLSGGDARFVRRHTGRDGGCGRGRKPMEPIPLQALLEGKRVVLLGCCLHAEALMRPDGPVLVRRGGEGSNIFVEVECTEKTSTFDTPL